MDPVQSASLRGLGNQVLRARRQRERLGVPAKNAVAKSDLGQHACEAWHQEPFSSKRDIRSTVLAELVRVSEWNLKRLVA